MGGEVREIEGLVGWARASFGLEHERQADRMLARVVTEGRAVSRCDVRWEPFVDVIRLRVQREIRLDSERLPAVTAYRVGDCFSALDPPAQVAPDLAVRGIAEDEAELPPPAVLAHENEVDARDRHRLFDELVRVGREVGHKVLVYEWETHLW